MSRTKQNVSSPGRPKHSGITSRALTPDEITRLLTVTKNNPNRKSQSFRNFVLIQFGIYTSARIGEIVNVSVGDVVEDGKVCSSVVFSRTKSKKSRRIPLNKHLQSLLQRFLDESSHHYTGYGENRRLKSDFPLFPSQKGGYFHPTAASKLIKVLLTDAGLANAGGSHVLRKSGLTMLHNSGVSLRTLQEISGHSNIQTLNAYLSTTTNQVEGAINSLRL
jgi:integrase/recombinase XerD